MEWHEAEFYRNLDRAGINFNPAGQGFDEFDIEHDVDETLTNIVKFGWDM